MNKSNERIMAVLNWLRKMPRWALILLSLGVIIVLGIAMFLLLPQQQPSSENSSSYLNSTGLAFSVFLKMGVVVLLIIGLAIILRRWKTKTFSDQAKQITLLETLHLTQHRTLYMISLDGKKILIGATDQSLVNLYQIDSDNQDHTIVKNESIDDFYSVLHQTQSSSEKRSI